METSNENLYKDAEAQRFKLQYESSQNQNVEKAIEIHFFKLSLSHY